MNRKMIMGIMILLVLLCIGAVLFILDQNVELQQHERDSVEAEKLLEQHNEHQSILQGKPDTLLTDADRLPPPGETYKTGHWDGNVWHRTVPAAVQTKTEIDSNDENSSHVEVVSEDLAGQARSPEEIEAYRKEWGVDPPPIGTQWQHLLNHNGEVMRHFNNSVSILYKVGIGFAPSVEQWEQHEILQEKLTQAKQRGETLEYDRILSELKVLIANSQGPVPIISGGVYSGVPISHTERNLKRKEAIRDVYRKFGLEHCISRL